MRRPDDCWSHWEFARGRCRLVMTWTGCQRSSSTWNLDVVSSLCYSPSSNSVWPTYRSTRAQPSTEWNTFCRYLHAAAARGIFYFAAVAQALGSLQVWSRGGATIRVWENEVPQNLKQFAYLVYNFSNNWLRDSWPCSLFYSRGLSDILREPKLPNPIPCVATGYLPSRNSFC